MSNWLEWRFYLTRVAPKLMPPVLLCWLSDVRDGCWWYSSRVEPSRQYSVKLRCRATDDSSGAVWQNGVWHGSAYEAKVCNWIPPCGKKNAPNEIHRRLLKDYGDQTVDDSTVRRWVSAVATATWKTSHVIVVFVSIVVSKEINRKHYFRSGLRIKWNIRIQENTCLFQLLSVSRKKSHLWFSLPVKYERQLVHVSSSLSSVSIRKLMSVLHSDLPCHSPSRRESTVSYGLDMRCGVFCRIEC